VETRSCATSAHEGPAVADAPERLDPLVGDVATCLPAFPVLRRQLTETVGQVEQAVVQVCHSFQSIADRARQSAAQATACLGDAQQTAGRGQGSAQELMATTHHTLARLLERVDNARALSLQLVGKMSEVEEGMQRIDQILRRIDSIASATKILALNARIEAARAGDRGNAFGVVAGETSKVAAAAAETSEAIRAIVQQVSQGVAQMTAELAARADRDEHDAAASRGEVDQAFQILTTTHEAMRQAAEAALRNSEEVAKSIAGAVMGLQFQDAVSQRVGHVVEALTEIETTLGANLGPERHGEPSPAAQAWMQRLAAGYTMDAERQAQVAEIGLGAGEPAQVGGTVELF
jgi:methyl-accepting chemotaxis protein